MSTLKKLQTTSFTDRANYTYLENAIKEVLGSNYNGFTLINVNTENAVIISNLLQPVAEFKSITMYVGEDWTYVNPASDLAGQLAKNLKEKIEAL